MHHDGVRRSSLKVLWPKTIMYCVLAHRGEKRGVLAFALNSKDHNNVCAFDGMFHTLLNPQPRFYQFAELGRYQRARTSNADCRTQLRQQMDVGSGNARVKHIANYRDLETLNPAFVF